MFNRTETALMARGVDSETAGKLRRDGYKLSSLMQKTDAQLRQLGLGDTVIANLRGAGRPRIPPENLIEVLFKSRFCCCVCRNREVGVVVHHIEEWSDSRSHAVKNLAVVCLQHHDEAHTTRGLTQNLTADKLRGFKAEWEGLVQQFDTQAILEAAATAGDAWLYFNHSIIFRMAQKLGVDLTQLPEYRRARRAGHCNKEGALNKRDKGSGWMYSGGDGISLYAYVENVLTALLEKMSVLNISDVLDRGALDVVLRPGATIVISGAHTFKGNTTRMVGPGQATVGERNANRVEVSFTFDKWEATSNSAHARWLGGRQNVASIVRVRSVDIEGGKMKITGTVLAISHATTGLKTREYSTYPYRANVWVSEKDDENDDDDSWLDDDE